MIQLEGPGANNKARAVRLGFVGLGWIGRLRMQSVLEGHDAIASCLYDPSDKACAEAMASAEGAERAESYEALLERDLDGVVIATPNALHEEQAVAALDRGLSVFCQKPLAPTSRSARRMIDVARANDRLLAVDWSYRHVRGIRRISDAARSGDLGDITAVELTFHNAYGPDGAWFYDRRRAGGGCLVDLGVHLLDLAMELIPNERLDVVASQTSARGRALSADLDSPAEDFVWATLRSSRGVAIRIACSWKAHTGADCEIRVRLHGSAGGACVRNIDGSFFDFQTSLQHGASEEIIGAEGDAWCGGSIRRWANSLSRGMGFDPSIERAVDVANLVEEIYDRSGGVRHAGREAACASS